MLYLLDNILANKKPAEAGFYSIKYAVVKIS